MTESNKTDIEYEPDFEVTTVPVEELDSIGVEEVEQIPEVASSSPIIRLKEKREGARSIFALIFLVGFILMISFSMVLGFLAEGDKVENIKEITLTISGILSGPMGFVVGYYFRRSEE